MVPLFPEPDRIPRFFFSYSREDARKDGLLYTFAGDLQRSVADRLRIHVDEAGFVDRSEIRAGESWGTTLGAALTTSRVLLCLVSESYLRSESCGKELSVFLRRRERHDHDPSVIIPIVWNPRNVMDPLPKVLGQFQVTDRAFPDDYLARGVRGLALAAPPASEYTTLVTALTDAIVTGAEFELEAIDANGLEPWDRLPNSLVPAEPVRRVGPAHILHMVQPFEVTFLHVNPGLAELPQERTKRGYEAAGGWYWKPYLPDSAQTIGQLVSHASVQYRCDDVPLHREDLVSYLVSAGRQPKAVVLVVDPWASLVPRLRQILVDIDGTRIQNYAVLIVHNGADRETMESTKLEDGLRAAFPNSFDSVRADYFRRDLRTADDVAAAVRSVLQKLSDSIAHNTAARMRIEGPPIPTLAPDRAA